MIIKTFLATLSVDLTFDLDFEFGLMSVAIELNREPFFDCSVKDRKVH